MNTLACICGPCCSFYNVPEPTPFPDPGAPEQMLLWAITALVLLFAVFITFKPIRRGCCLWCGYALAGIGERAVCPECGKNRQT